MNEQTEEKAQQLVNERIGTTIKASQPLLRT